MSGPRLLRRFTGSILSALLVIACTPQRSAEPPVAPASTSPTPATKPAPTVDRERLTAGLDAYIEGFGAHWGPAFRFSGFVLVTQGDEVLYQRGFGQADRVTGRVPDIDTSFRVGSVTKQFTAAAILKLREQGKLDVSDTVGTHLPEIPAPLSGVTIHQLLTHTAGVWSYTSDPKLREKRAEPHSVQQMLALFQDRPLDFPPGSAFRYSNSGYVVLGAIIEAASGMPYGDYLQRELFGPAGMTRTQHGDHEGLDDRAIGYEMTPMETIEAAHPIHMSVPYSAGGIRSTARDLWRWHKALSGAAILKEDSKALLYTPDKDDYAYGWGVQSHEGREIIGHGGGIDGFVCDYKRLVDDDIVLVAWTNTGPQAAQVASAVFPLVLGEPAPRAPQELAPAPFDPAIVPKVAGSYLLTADSRAKLGALGIPGEAIATFERIELGHDDQSLTLAPIGQPKQRLHAKGDGKFFTKELEPAIIELIIPEGAERAQAVRSVQGPYEALFERAAEPEPKGKGKGKRLPL